MKQKMYLMIAFMLVTLTSFAQRTPDWVTNIPNPTNSTYLYVMETGSGWSELDARNQAFAKILQTTIMRLGMPISSEEINRAVQRGTEFSVISRQYNIPINKVCEYSENKSGNYKVYVLCQVAKAGNVPVQFDGFNNCYEGVNKKYAEEALSAKGWDVYENGIKLDERSIRSRFANSRSYDLYDRGMRIRESEWFNNRGERYTGNSYLSLIGGGAIAGGGLYACIGYTKYSGKNATEEDKVTGERMGQIGLTVMAVGGAVMLVKYIVNAYGKSQVRKAVRLYNNGKMYSQNGLDMEYGFTGSGVFLSLYF